MYQLEEQSSLDIGKSGYRMIDSFRVNNFRCFTSLQLKGLKRINIIVGTNASGKTVLLEAINMGLRAYPQNILFLDQLRGLQPLLFPNQTPEQFRSLFIDLFHNFEDKNPISMSFTDSLNRTASVKIFFDPKHAVTTQQVPQSQGVGFQPGGTPSVNPPATTIIPLAFDRVGFAGEKSVLYATVQNGSPFLPPGTELGVPSMFFSSGYASAPQENANWYSALSVQKKGEKFLATIQKHFPFVHGLSTEQFMPGILAVYVDIPTVARKLPASFVSWGFNRFLTLTLAVYNCKGGVILIDEVENGIYHNQHPALWKTLSELAEEYDAQLFVSTHSKECLKAALPIVKGNEENISLLRTERMNGSCDVTLIEGKMFESALEQGFDVR